MTKICICIKCKREWNVFVKHAGAYICPECENKILATHIKTVRNQSRKASKDVCRPVLLRNKKKWGNRIG